MINQKTWKEFRETGLFWWINQLLHTFGWALVLEIDENGEVTSAYPARVKFRGFNESLNTDGYIKVSKYLKENAEELLKESQE
jgi:hypothetical protein